jgi:DNA ligase-1
MHNGNEATVGELGQTKRTSHQENLVPLETMGALIVRDLKTGVEFNIGTGFTDEERSWWWQRYNSFDYNIGCTVMNNGGQLVTIYEDPFDIVKYKFFATGSKDKPRFPAYLGIRHQEDI